VIGRYDNKPIRCPRIGGEINFKYCRLENKGLPCRWITGCWQSGPDVERFLREHYTDEELAKAFAPPKPRMQSLLELVEAAKKTMKDPSE
jgi:hypothetical protein